MIAAISIIVGISILVLIHELGHFLAAKKYGIKVEEFGFGFPPRMFGVRRGETLYSFNWLPFGGFVRIYGEHPERLAQKAEETGAPIERERAFCFQPLWRRFVVIAAGISINFIAGWLLLSLVLAIGARQAVVVSEIQPGSPAQAVGLAVGDELAGFTTAEEFISFTRMNQRRSIELFIVRDGEQKTLRPTLRLAADGEAPLGAAVSSIGFARLPIHHALMQGLTDSLLMVGEIFKAFGGLLADLFGRASVPENIVGPVGIFGLVGDLGDLGIVYVIQLIAMISLNLAALNAIPFPALDGGRILFLLIEKIKGSPLNPVREQWANVISFGFLVLLMIVITGRDIVRLF